MTREATGLVRVPRLTSRSGIVWLVGTALVCAAVLGYVLMDQPENRWTLWVIVPLFLIPVVVGLTRRCWVDTSNGTLVWQRLWVWRTRVALDSARSVELVPDRGGGLLLGVRGAEHRTTRYLKVLALTDYVTKSLPPDVLEVLSEQVAGRCPPRVAGDVPGLLRKQARHLRDGGDARTSPLASRVSRTMSRLAKGGGAVGGGSGLVS